MFPWFSNRIHRHPLAMLWHYANAELPWNISPDSEEVRWRKNSHRGVQFLNKLHFPKKQLRYIFNPNFELRFNHAFEDVLRHCATAPRKSGKPWLTDELIQGYLSLHRLGHAHSFETWQAGRLVGGAFGIQLGAYITCESMFHLVSNASKAAWGQTLVRLRDRGFTWIDTNCVATHDVKYGEEWVPQWKFEQLHRQAIYDTRSLADDIPCPRLPWQIDVMLRAATTLRTIPRAARALTTRLRPLISRPPATSN